MLRQMDTEKEMKLLIFIIRRITASASPNARNKGSNLYGIKKKSRTSGTAGENILRSVLAFIFLPHVSVDCKERDMPAQ